MHVAQYDRSGREPATPPSRDAIIEKYRGCASPLLSAEATDASIDVVAHLEQAVGIGHLMDLVRGEAA